MDSRINNNQISYLFYHLNFHFNFSEEIRARIIFDNFKLNNSSKIYFQLSDKKLDRIKYLDEIPILFPLNDEKEYYFIDDNNNLIFNDDLLKSAFYLLAGYQEFDNWEKDVHDRFTYNFSIQKSLDIAYFPLVNFYFEKIIIGIETFCKLHNIEFKRKKSWKNNDFAFFLSHDVDRIDKYTLRNLRFTLKILFGFVHSDLNIRKTLKLFLNQIIGIFGQKNPDWNFEWMKSIEEKHGFNSVWFFLPQGDPDIDAFYSFEEKRIKKLVASLQKYGDEIGIHGTYHSMNNKKIFHDNFLSLKKLLGYNPIGNRQHWLRFKYPNSLRIMENLGLKYDSSWGFNDHAGWRNSYCLPFRPYDIENDRMMDIWEIPLVVMDVSLLIYQKLSLNEALTNLDKILENVIRFNGLFSLLWHNNNFDEDVNPGITEFYLEILNKIARYRPFNLVPGKYILDFDTHGI